MGLTHDSRIILVEALAANRDADHAVEFGGMIHVLPGYQIETFETMPTRPLTE